ncbi:hypothetical protein DFH94DRAFT_679430 [Russula ochroleuca]|uniref:RRM domain-containing protein n=1 Tax=Russula ochroleuca TaxID=152965 RepID=A0A9P5N336_9AGAM|nr:hypothetical protein DFH94DRAFT_679430 [Russula ochroleuca]
MSTRGRSASPESRDVDVDMDKQSEDKSDVKAIAVTNLTRNVVEAHLQTVFGFYGEVVKIDLPIYVKSGQNKGKAYLEYADAASARTAMSHMNGGQLDGAALKVELSEMPLQRTTTATATRARTRSRSPPFRPRNGRERERPRSPSRSRSRSRSPRFPRRDRDRDFTGGRGYNNDSYRRPPPPPPPRRPPARDVYRPRTRTRTRSRSRSPPIRRGGMLGPRRRSPSYERGGYGRRGQSRSYTSSSFSFSHTFPLALALPVILFVF